MKKRLFLLVILPVLSLIVTGGVLYFFLVYRLKDSINFIINKESGGRYAFDASEASLSIWDKHLSLKNSVLYCKDSAGIDAYYKVQIPGIYFSITSWRQLLFHKKLIVDSLAITRPDIYINVQKADIRRSPVNFQAADILTCLEKALSHFNIHKFSLTDAAFTYQQPGATAPLHGDHINLAVSNFTVINNEDSHLLGSDKISVLLGQQHWVLPDGRHEIGFSRMTFDSKGQRFELDSFYFRGKADTGVGEIRLYADKFFFNSRHLPAIYQKDQLLLDTLICEGPVLTIPSGAGAGQKDTVGKPRFRGDLFKWINVGFIAVTDGQLLLQNKDGITQNTATRKANLHIYNLGIDPAKNPSISTDSILLNLKNIEFVTPDSLYKLSIDEFAFLKNNAIFRNAQFGPVRPQDKQVTFTAPSLLLKDISIVDLMQGKLKASGAELRQPRIVLSTSSPAPVKKNTLFYQTLHHISGIINTRDLHLLDGALSFRHGGTVPISADAEHFDLHILLNKLFISDSLADIKHAISASRVGRFGLQSEGLTIQANDFTFDGTHAHSQGRQLDIRTAGGLVLKGEDISWDFFDWDLFQRNKSIQIEAAHAGRLNIHVEHSSSDAHNKQPPTSPLPIINEHPPRPLPIINIGRLTVNEILFDGSVPNGRLGFTITDLQADSFRTVPRSSIPPEGTLSSGQTPAGDFNWSRLKMNGSHLAMEGKKGQVLVKQLNFDSNRELIIKGVEFESRSDAGHTKLSLPQLRISTAWHSSDLSGLTIASLVADDMRFAFSGSGPGSGPHSGSPVKDTVLVTTGGAIRADNISPWRGGIKYDSLRLDLKHTQARKGPLQLHIPASSLQLSDGHLTFQTSNGHPTLRPAEHLSRLLFAWNDMGLTYNKDSVSLTTDGLSGSFKKDALRLSSGASIGWQQAVVGTTITKGEVHYKGKKITADAKGFSFDPLDQALSVKNFSVLPNAGREETFSQAQWQGDYITIKGSLLTLAGIRWRHDSLLNVDRLILDGINLEASRDKRMPFRHGIEKPMPTRLINTIPFAVRVDTIHIRNSHVTYNELSVLTHQWSSIPIRDINGYLVHIGNRDNLQDTLGLLVTARLFDGNIRHFAYKEFYGDSLSAFAASSYFSPLDLTQFSRVSVPAAAVRVTRGRADTVFSSWAGNKYATYGTMNFYYNDLRVQVLNKKDIHKGGLLPALETWLANLILPARRQRSSAIFVQRDREKFVFNYWVKAQASGVLTTVGIKKSKKYRKLYQQTHKQYSLPARP
ncbi:MAG: hypothetical protein J0H74_25360 [Chitinophagaceae bacterium]|nr:hypothetical protein [Chitinophagaceae bacterium]